MHMRHLLVNMRRSHRARLARHAAAWSVGLAFAFAAHVECQPARAAEVSTARLDSAAVQRVTAYLVQSLSGSLALAATDTASQPWDITMPEDSPDERWRGVRETLMMWLRARPARDSDPRRRMLRLRRVVVQGDSLLAEVSIGSAVNCGDRWMGDRTEYRVSWVRVHQTSWGPPVAKPILWAESFGLCPP